MLMPDSAVSVLGSSGNWGRVMMIQAAVPRVMRRASATIKRMRMRLRFGIKFTGRESRVKNGNQAFRAVRSNPIGALRYE